MCGVAGIASRSRSKPDVAAAIERMKSAMIDRGPDAEGTVLLEGAANGRFGPPPTEHH